MIRPEATHSAPAGETPVVLAYPLLRDGQLFGVLSLRLEALDDAQQPAALHLLQWGSALLDFMLRQGNAADVAGRLATVIEATLVSLRQGRFQAAATAAVSHLVTALDCERVSVGFVRHNHVHIRAVSNTAQVDRRSNLVQDIEAAMEEAFDEGEVIVYPDIGKSQATHAHERLSNRQGSKAVCTVPMIDENKTIGVLCFERSKQPVFDPLAVELCGSVATLLGPVLELKRLEDQPIMAKAGHVSSSFLTRLFGPRHPRTKLAAASIIVLVGFLSFATGQYRVAASASLEGTVHRALVAPIDGYIKTAEVRSGSIVKEADLLAELDDTDLELERRKWASQRDEIQRQHRRAVAQFDRAEAKILEAELGRSEAQLALVDEQLSRIRIVAPFDGVVVTGDLSHSLGAPVQRGQLLFEIAPLDSYRMILNVDESDIADVTQGQRGQLMVAAMPGKNFTFVVERIVGLANTDEGRNVFEVEARLEGESDKVRPGMKGVGKIAIGERRLIWVWTHNLVERVGLWIWSYLP